jgi:hypothetical protein
MDIEDQLILIDLFNDLYEDRMRYNQRNQLLKKFHRWSKQDEESPDWLLFKHILFLIKDRKRLKLKLKDKQVLKFIVNDKEYYHDEKTGLAFSTKHPVHVLLPEVKDSPSDD